MPSVVFPRADILHTLVLTDEDLERLLLDE
jgi:hypothetical protein